MTLCLALLDLRNVPSTEALYMPEGHLQLFAVLGRDVCHWLRVVARNPEHAHDLVAQHQGTPQIYRTIAVTPVSALTPPGVYPATDALRTRRERKDRREDRRNA